MDTKVISTGIPYSKLPESYIRPESDRPNLSQVQECENVPVIDLGCEDRDLIIQEIGDACTRYGFFQVINHGVGKEIVESMEKVGSEFFSLPLEEKLKVYSDDPSKTMRLSTSFNVKKETIHNWRDYLRLHCYPLDQYVPEWPSNPSSFKEIVSNYCKEVRKLGLRLEEAISESLGLEKEYIQQVLGEQGQHMAINFYPECPQPDLTYGLPGHTDPNALTILLQDLHVSGLQVLKDGRWLAVKPHPNAFVINLGDQLQVRILRHNNVGVVIRNEYELNCIRIREKEKQKSDALANAKFTGKHKSTTSTQGTKNKDCQLEKKRLDALATAKFKGKHKSTFSSQITTNKGIY